MANEIQTSIFHAIDTLVGKRMDSLELDRTITATISKCVNPLTNEFQLKYNGGTITAYAQNGATYKDNTSVYVLVPENDFSKTKYIVGRAQHITEDDNITFVASTLNNYNLIGANALQKKLALQPEGQDKTPTPIDVYPQGLSSYKKEDYVLFYNRDYAYAEDASLYNQNLLTIDEESFYNSIQESEALLVEGTFQTSLPSIHKAVTTGTYGVDFILAFKDSSITKKDAEDGQGIDSIKYVTYSLNVNNMTGNPFGYNSWTDQYNIFPIDAENFLYVQAIFGYCKGFTETSQKEASVTIRIKDLELYGLKALSNENDGYRLKLSMPAGNTFKTIRIDETLRVVATVAKDYADITNQINYYWFIEDAKVNAYNKSEYYHIYGGAGWRKLNSTNLHYLDTSAESNRAFKNKYKCVAVYQDSVVLIETFTLFNEAVKVDLSIISSLGYNFSFDLGTPTLTCLINGEEPPEDQNYEFYWMKSNSDGSTQIFSTPKEKLEEEYQKLISGKDEDGNPIEEDILSYGKLSDIKAQLAALDGVSWNWNKLIYPSRHMKSDSVVTFKCSVYKGAYLIGTAEQAFLNTNITSPERFVVTIENGEQTFQYSETGVSPANDARKQPIEILPLKAHLFDNQTGVEIDASQFDVRWQFPTARTMLIPPKAGIVTNAANGEKDICVSQYFNFTIDDTYDYSTKNNQVTCLVSYKGNEVREVTNFLFTKVGENGTNGTDIIAKISVKNLGSYNVNSEEVLTLYAKKGEDDNFIPSYWNTEIGLKKPNPSGQSPLNFQLYECNNLIPDELKVSWSFAGGSSSKSYPLIASGGQFVGADLVKPGSTLFRNQVVKGEVRYEGNSYYAFYPISVVYIYKDLGYRLAIDDKETLKYVTYNSDGRNPLYNTSQGVKISLVPDDFRYSLGNKTVELIAEGGITKINNNKVEVGEHPTNCAFTIVDKKDIYELNDEENTLKVDILPNEVYDGAYSNNVVHGIIRNANEEIECEFYIPIHLSLNTYGLSSLNAWDGNHIEINEDESYIMAPQIGAGIKNNKNQFTGIVMGTTGNYTYDDEQVGLLGYSEGEQSIYLNAKDGSATFGLPETQGSANNRYLEGQIALNPGGLSHIGSWYIGSRAFFNVNGIDKSYLTPDGKLDQSKLSPYKDLVKNITGSQKDILPTISIPHDKSGILLNSEPSYMSIKGKKVEEYYKGNINFGHANTIVQPHDSFEAQLDPQDSSLFTIYRHTNEPELKSGSLDIRESVYYTDGGKDKQGTPHHIITIYYKTSKTVKNENGDVEVVEDLIQIAATEIPEPLFNDTAEEIEKRNLIHTLTNKCLLYSDKVKELAKTSSEGQKIYEYLNEFVNTLGEEPEVQAKVNEIINNKTYYLYEPPTDASESQEPETSTNEEENAETDTNKEENAETSTGKEESLEYIPSIEKLQTCINAYTDLLSDMRVGTEEYSKINHYLDYLKAQIYACVKYFVLFAAQEIIEEEKEKVKNAAQDDDDVILNKINWWEVLQKLHIKIALEMGISPKRLNAYLPQDEIIDNNFDLLDASWVEKLDGVRESEHYPALPVDYDLAIWSFLEVYLNILENQNFSKDEKQQLIRQFLNMPNDVDKIIQNTNPCKDWTDSQYEQYINELPITWIFSYVDDEVTKNTPMVVALPWRCRNESGYFIDWNPYELDKNKNVAWPKENQILVLTVTQEGLVQEEMIELKPKKKETDEEGAEIEYEEVDLETVLTSQKNFHDPIPYSWHREAKVGISNQGRFYTNALRDSNTAMNIGNVGAFGTQAQDKGYIGTSFELNDDVLVKMFTEITTNGYGENLYISGSSNPSNEYTRPISLHGKSIMLNTSAKSIGKNPLNNFSIEPELLKWQISEEITQSKEDGTTSQQRDYIDFSCDTRSKVNKKDNENQGIVLSTNKVNTNGETKQTGLLKLDIDGNFSDNIKTFNSNIGLDYTHFIECSGVNDGTKTTDTTTVNTVNFNKKLSWNNGADIIDISNGAINFKLGKDSTTNFLLQAGGLGNKLSTKGFIAIDTAGSFDLKSALTITLKREVGTSITSLTLGSTGYGLSGGSTTIQPNNFQDKKWVQIWPRIHVLKDDDGVGGQIYADDSIIAAGSITTNSSFLYSTAKESPTYKRYDEGKWTDSAKDKTKNSYSSAGVWSHLNHIYKLIDAIRSEITSWTGDHYSETGHTHSGYATETWVKNQGYDKVDWSKVPSSNEATHQTMTVQMFRYYFGKATQ